jgi:hypothetical protein
MNQVIALCGMKYLAYIVLAIACFGHAAETSYYTCYIWEGLQSGVLLLSVFLWIGWPAAIWRAGATKFWPLFCLPGLIALWPTFKALFWQFAFSGMH